MKKKSRFLCIALMIACSGTALADEPANSATRLSPKGIRAKVAALKKEDVAWRKIQWKTCLLDGLKASREQNKPIMLWIFIDRPIDDERC
jgi:hypothetical protein